LFNKEFAKKAQTTRNKEAKDKNNNNNKYKKQ